MSRPRRRGRDINGVLLLDKPQGMSSNDALQKVKRIYNANRAGHTGALDPLATGMLPICLGEATKFSQYLLDSDKRYRVIARLGQRTDTSDADGQIVEERPVTFSAEQLAAALDTFRGDIEQIPSMYSALKYQGKKLYEYARLGGAKVVWLNDAALLTEAAANALLKTLEEPPENTWFFLSCREPERLLATLRSRCLLHHLAVPQESWALAWLEREVTVSQDAARSALRLCSGAPAAALALLQPEVWSQRETLCRAVESALDSHDWLSVLPALNSDQAPERLHWLAALLLDALKIQQGATLLTNPDVWALVTTLANRLSGQSLHAILHDICQSREQLLTVTGLNRELLLTDQLLRIEHYLQPGVIPPVSHL